MWWKFDLLSCKLHLKCYNESHYIGIALEQNKITILSQFPVKLQNQKMVSFATSVMKNIFVLSFTFWLRLRFPVKLIYCIAFGSESSACCSRKSIASIL